MVQWYKVCLNGFFSREILCETRFFMRFVIQT